MNRPECNAFTRSEASADPGGRLSGAGAPVRSLIASLDETPYGWSMSLEPLRAVDAALVWPSMSPDESGRTLLLGAEQSVWVEGGRPLTAGEICDRLQIDAECITDDAIVLDDTALQQLLSLVSLDAVHLVRIDGPIEAADAEAIGRALAQGISPLRVEVRATAALCVLSDREVTVEVRQPQQAMAMLSEAFRQYVAGWLNRVPSTLERPALYQVERLASVSGTVTVRPIETDRYPTSIDIGVSTEGGGADGPADASLIFDIPSNSWHDEP